MKFKTKEELIKEIKEESGSDFTGLYDAGIIDGVEISFKSFVERVEFYKKYRYDEEGLNELNPSIWETWLKSKEIKLYKAEMENGNYLLAEEWYEDWLFDYCFQDVK